MAANSAFGNDWMSAHNRRGKYKCGQCVCFTTSEPEQLCAIRLAVVSRHANACSKGKAKKIAESENAHGN